MAKSGYYIDGKEIYQARHASGWNMSLFGRPKITVHCGNCSYVFKTRDWFTLRVEGSSVGSVSTCPTCAEMNFFRMVYG